MWEKGQASHCTLPGTRCRLGKEQLWERRQKNVEQKLRKPLRGVVNTGRCELLSQPVDGRRGNELIF